MSNAPENAKDSDVKKPQEEAKPKQSAVRKKLGFSKEVYAIALACITTAVSVIIAKIVAPIILSKEVEDVFTLDQSHWEYGTLGHVEFQNPNIKAMDEYFSFHVKIPYVGNFDVSSFINHKFSLEDNRMKRIESNENDQKNYAIISLVDDKKVIFGPERFRIQGVRKNESALDFNLHWASSADKKKLKELVRTIADKPSSRVRLIFDFIHDNSLMHKHVGIISEHGVMRQEGKNIIYEIDLSHQDDAMHTRATIYGMGENNFKHSVKANAHSSSNGQNSSPYIDLNEEWMNGMGVKQPMALMFSSDKPIIGVLKSIQVVNNKLQIVFTTKDKIDESLYNYKRPAHIVFNTLSKDKPYTNDDMDAGGEMGDLNGDRDAITFDRKQQIFGLISTENMTFAWRDQYYEVIIAEEDLQNMQIESLFKKQLFSDGKSQKKDIRIGASQPLNMAYLNYNTNLNDKALMIKCCIKISDIKKENGSVKFFLHTSGRHSDEVYIEKMTSDSIFKKQNLTSLLFTNKSLEDYSFITSSRAWTNEEDGLLVIDLPLRKDAKGQYNNPGFLISIGNDTYSFSPYGHGQHVLSLSDSKPVSKIVSRYFRELLGFKTRTAVLINGDSFYGEIADIVVDDVAITIKLKLLGSVKANSMKHNASPIVIITSF